MNNEHVEGKFKEETWIAIPLAEYEKLTAQKNESEKLQKQLQHHMKLRPIVPSTSTRDNVNVSDNASIKNETVTKLGQGVSVTTNAGQPNSNIISELVLQVHNIQQVLQQLSQAPKADCQIGSGAQYLTVNLPDPLPVPESDNNAMPQNQEDIAYKTDSKQSDSDISRSLYKQLPGSVSPHLQFKAKKLLAALDSHTDAIQFMPNGKIILSSKNLGGENIFQLFPFLFKPSLYSKHPN